MLYGELKEACTILRQLSLRVWHQLLREPYGSTRHRKLVLLLEQYHVAAYTLELVTD